MGKRSEFERIPRDYYPTPIEAVYPLVPHLPDGLFHFTEPCAGDGRLADHIAALTMGHCEKASDIEPRGVKVQKADALAEPDEMAAMFITNPPWDRKVLHPLIVRLSDIAPTWLLFDADWMHTKQAAQFMPRLRKVVSVGRVKWIEGSKMTGKDNCCWYLFQRPDPADDPTEFIGRVAFDSTSVSCQQPGASCSRQLK
mgnify:CR=1 FL=1